MSSDSHPRVPKSVRYQAVVLSEISRGGGGGGGRGWKQREGHNFLRLRKRRGHEKWAVKRGGHANICRDNVEVHPQKKKEVLYLLKKRKKTRTTEHCGYKL